MRSVNSIRVIAQSTAVFAILTGVAQLPAFAQVVGSQATGTLQFNGGGTNYFDPANGFVPAGFLNKTQGATVTVDDPAIDFGFKDGANTDTADITDTQLIITDVSVGGAAPFKMTFNDPAFDDMTLVSSDFPTFSASLVGSLFTFNAGEITRPGTYQAVYNVRTAAVTGVPEPGSVALLAGMGVTGTAVAVSRLRRRRK